MYQNGSQPSIISQSMNSSLSRTKMKSIKKLPFNPIRFMAQSLMDFAEERREEVRRYEEEERAR